MGTDERQEAKGGINNQYLIAGFSISNQLLIFYRLNFQPNCLKFNKYLSKINYTFR